MNSTVLPALLALGVLAATVTPGGRLFGAATVAAAGAGLWHLGAALDGAGPRPILPAAAVAAVGIPIRLLLDPSAGIAAVPPLLAAMLLAGFVLSMLGGRQSVTIALGATLVCGLLVGIGGGGLLLLRDAAGGTGLTVGLLLLIVLPEAAAALGRRVRGDELAEGMRLVAVAVVGGGLLAAQQQAPAITVGVVVAALVASYAAALLSRVLSTESTGPTGAAAGAAAPAVRVLLALLLATPVSVMIVVGLQS